MIGYRACGVSGFEMSHVLTEVAAPQRSVDVILTSLIPVYRSNVREKAGMEARHREPGNFRINRAY